MSIEKIELYNFQSHKKTVLEMGKMTVLTGGSNSGKSAVLRALGGLLRNDSVGDYLSHGQKHLKVSILMSDGRIVEWEKGTGLNQYKIIDERGREDLFQKVGTDIPEEVASVIGIAPITMEGGQKLHINLHEQLETPFLVGKEHTAGFTAKVFGEVTSAAKLQASIQEGNRLIRSDLSKSKLKRSDLSELDEKLLQFIGLDIQVKSLDNAKGLYLKASDLLKKADSIYRINAQIEKDTENLFLFSARIEELAPVERVNLKQIEEKGREIDSLSNLISSIKATEDKAFKIKEYEVIFEKANSDKELSKLSDLADKSHRLNKIISGLNLCESEMGAFEKAIKTNVEKVEKYDRKIEELWSGLEDCPTCGQSLEEEPLSRHARGVHA